MLVYVKDSLLTSPAKVLVNPVNTVGIMGKGLAKEFKHLYPDMFKRYRELCEAKKFSTGQLWLYKTSEKWILNFPTKQNWRQRSRLEYIESGLQKFVATYKHKNIRSIAFPQLGCGNGELSWENGVQSLMEHYLRPLQIEIYIHLFDATDAVPEHQMTELIRQILQTEPRSIPFMEFWGDLNTQIARQSHYRTLDTHMEFDVALSNNNQGITIIAS